MSTALTNCPSCGAPLDRSAAACSRCGTPIIKSGGEQTSQAISAAGDAVKKIFNEQQLKNTPTGAAVAIHSCFIGLIPVLMWLLLIPLVCAFLKEGHILRTHARVWWRWIFDLLGTAAACAAVFGAVGGGVMAFSESLGLVILVPGALLILAIAVFAIIHGIKAAMAASDGIVYTYPKLLLSTYPKLLLFKFGLL